jgi:foldase protein PrsA
LSKWNLAIIFGAVLVLCVVLVGVGVGLGSPDVPDDDVAVVDDDSITVPGVIEEGKISKENFDRILEQTARQQGLDAVPPPSDPQYAALRDQAMNTALDVAWITGEGQRRGVDATDTEVQQSFEQTKAQNFQTEEEYQQFLTQQGLTQDDVLQRVKLQVISGKIEDALSGDAATPSEDDAKEYYDANADSFTQPEQRTIRIIQNADPAKAQQAFDMLSADSSPANWKKVAAELSTDPQSKDSGGVRPDVVTGTFEQPLDDEIFAAPQGELEGPVATPTGQYVFQVDSITPERTQSFDELKDQISQQIASSNQQEAFAAFLNDYRSYWGNLTFCAEDYRIVRCDNFDGELNPCPDPTLTDQQQQQQLDAQGCPPAVLSTTPAVPGSIQLFAPSAGGQPQRPHPAGEATAPPGGGLPGGVIPTG